MSANDPYIPSARYIVNSFQFPKTGSAWRNAAGTRRRAAGVGTPVRTTRACRQAVCLTGPGSLWLGRPVSTWPAKRRTILSSPPRSVVAVTVRSYQPWLDDSSK